MYYFSGQYYCQNLLTETSACVSELLEKYFLRCKIPSIGHVNKTIPAVQTKQQGQI
jgi:hypothetical protein